MTKKKPPKRERGPFLMVEVTPDEKEAFERAAAARGKTLSVLTRELLRAASGLPS